MSHNTDLCLLYSPQPLWPDSAVEECYSHSPEDEYEKLRSDIVWIDLSNLTLLSITGAEAHDFIQSLLTCDIKKSNGWYGALLSPKGKTQFIIDGLCIDRTEIWLYSHDPDKKLFEAIDKYLIMSDCSIEDISEKYSISHISGPHSRRIISEKLTAEEIPTTHFDHVRTHEKEIIRMNPRFGEWGFDILSIKNKENSIQSKINSLNIQKLGSIASETARVESGYPRHGPDISINTAWLEASQHHGISFTKGCYIGQESIAMSHFRGKPNKQLLGIAFESKPTPDHTTIETQDGNPAGRITSILWSPMQGMWVGLAFIKTRILELPVPPKLIVSSEGATIPITLHPLPFYWAQDLPEHPAQAPTD